MALQVNLNNTYGVPLLYWKISAIHLAYQHKKCQIYVVGYYNEQARLDEKKPIETNVYTIKDNDFDMYLNVDKLNMINNNIMKGCYEWLKNNTEEFKNSLDI